MKSAIRALIQNIPPLVQIKEDPQKSKETLFAKAKFISKTFLPPSCIPGNKVVTVVEDRSCLQRDSVSPLTSTAASPSTHSTQPRSASPAMAPSSPSLPSRTLQNRPSVLRIAPSRQSVAAYNSVVDSCHITSTSSGDNEAVAEGKTFNDNVGGHKFRTYAKGSRTTNVVKSDFIKQECIKQETVDLDEFDELNTQLVARAGVVRRIDSVPNECVDESDRTGVVIRRSAIKRHFDYDGSSFASTVPNKKNSPNIDLTPCADHLKTHQNTLHANNLTQLSPHHQTSYNRNLCFSILNTDANSVPETAVSQLHQFTQLSVVEECDHGVQLVGIGRNYCRYEYKKELPTRSPGYLTLTSCFLFRFRYVRNED